jgi:hypothetical protein
VRELIAKKVAWLFYVTPIIIKKVRKGRLAIQRDVAVSIIDQNKD